MLDISHELVNKLTLNIMRHPDSDSKIGVLRQRSAAEGDSSECCL